MIFLRFYRWLWLLVPVIVYIMWCCQAIEDLRWLIKNNPKGHRLYYFFNGEDINCLQSFVFLHLLAIFGGSLIYFIVTSGSI